jgi:membrane-bound serine protease (ClpP class)
MALGALLLLASSASAAIRARVPRGVLMMPMRESQDRGPKVHQVSLRGIVDPASARFIERELRDAEESEARAFLVRLDTPGGLDVPMREIVQAFLRSSVPVIVWVEPQGARAASAGVFIALAAHAAVMAPGTTIGAAHPVALGSPDPVQEKWVNDAAALARAIARERGRNADWAELAVRRSVALTAREALDEGVIDAVSPDLGELARALQGKIVATPAGPRTLELQGAPVVAREMRSSEVFLHAIAEPNVAYLLFSLGVLALLAELYHPGVVLPGVAGATCLVLALVSFGSLPVNGGALALLVIGVGLFVAEVHASTSGLAGALGLVLFVLGSLWLYEPRASVGFELRVSRLLVGTIAGVLVVFFAYVARAVLMAHERPIATGVEALLGSEGAAIDALEPSGRVRVAGETWSATATAPVAPGERVRVTAVSGAVLTVRPLRGEPHALEENG